MPVGVGMFIIMMVMMAGGKGFVAHPALHINTFGRGIEEAELKQPCWIDGPLDASPRTSR